MRIAEQLRQEGRQEEIIKVVKNAIVKGMEVEDIVELTGLTEKGQRFNVSIRFKPEGCSAHCDMDGSGNIHCSLCYCSKEMFLGILMFSYILNLPIYFLLIVIISLRIISLYFGAIYCY